MIDIIVIGSGPSGAIAAKRLVQSGSKVVTLDVGEDDENFRNLIPDESLDAIRIGEPNQNTFFLGENLEGIPSGNVRVGSQLTPPRQFITRLAETLLPLESDSFFPLQSLALGGIGAGWGEASFTFSKDELKRIGIEDERFIKYYEKIANWIGISANLEDDAAPFLMECKRHILPPLDIDVNSKKIYKQYKAKSEWFKNKGFHMGLTPLAILSKDYKNRKANPYFDMDFYSDSRKANFRPRYIIDELKTKNNYDYIKDALVVSFKEKEKSVEVFYKDIKTRKLKKLEAKAIVLCAGSINSARIALNSLNLFEEKTPILCSPYTYVPMINLGMLGRPDDGKRHSLSQLSGFYSTKIGEVDGASVQFYSYKSLMLFKLIKEIPLPLYASKLIVRLLVNSISIAGIFFPDYNSVENYLSLKKLGNELKYRANFKFKYEPDKKKIENKLLQIFLRLNCVPFAKINPGNGSSIHYAGTIPYADSPYRNKIYLTKDGRLNSLKRVYVADSSGWKYLPAKGLTFTIMANALKTSENILKRLKYES